MRLKLFSFLVILSLTGSSLALAQGPTPTLPPSPVPTQTFDTLAAQFDYDTTAPLDIQEVGSEMRGDVAVHDITFTGSPDTTIQAYLVVPPGKGPFAAILWVHWYEPGDPISNRTEFLDEAVTLAGSGVESLLVSTLWSKSRFWQKKADHDVQVSVGQVIDLRRGLDLLLARPEVDPERLALVGHDFGGMYSAVTAAVDHRAKAVVIMASTPRFSDWFMLNTPNKPQAYVDALAAIDPITYVPFLAPTAVFFQFAKVDHYVLRDVAQAFFDAASEPKKAGFDYGGFHALDDVARQDRDAWLAEQLGLTLPG